MAPNFCSNCGHRIYQHNADGCEHVDITEAEGEGPLQRQMVTVRTPCDCKQPHPLMIGADT
jgi:hypothetical protein